VVNVHLTQRTQGDGYHYAPDPSSQGACTIGGNVATNSGGPHTLKYGVTVNHVLGVEASSPMAASCNSAARRKTPPATT
jgi:glycolate oxidase